MSTKIRELRHRIKARTQKQAASAASLYGVEPTDSRAARIGSGLIAAAVFIEFITPVVVVLAMITLTAFPALAQTPGGGVFGSNDQTVGRGLVEFIKYFRNLIFLAGIFFFGWAGVNMGFEKPWGGKAMAGVACWGFAGISALAYSFSQGQAVNLDTNLGN